MRTVYTTVVLALAGLHCLAAMAFGLDGDPTGAAAQLLGSAFWVAYALFSND
jgi:threonine/homoserine efflux transporter RhtA